jgi:aminopeptidase
MRDQRIQSLAALLTNYSLNTQKDDRVLIQTFQVAEPLVSALVEEILKAGGHPLPLVYPDSFEESMLRYGDEGQISLVRPFEYLAYSEYESRISILASLNTKKYSTVEPNKLQWLRKSRKPILATQMEREARGDFRRVTTMFPTEAYAQNASLSLSEYEDFFFKACQIHDGSSNPTKNWQAREATQRKYLAALNGGETVQLQSSDCDLTFSIRDRTFISSHGLRNMPDGEIYTGPVEDSVNGRVRFTYPAIFGVEISGIEVEFEGGKAVAAKADTGDAVLKKLLDTDRGSRYLGEFGIGTNYEIKNPIGNALMDEKIGGSIHLAFGMGYPRTGSVNKSTIHWDMVTDFSTDSRIMVDGEVIYRDGKFVI